MKFKRLKPTAQLSVLVLLLSLLTGCTQLNATANSDNSTTTPIGSSSMPLFSNHSLLQEIYNLDTPDYSVYSSEALDIYFISCALYFDFQSQQLLPKAEEDAFYQQVKNYFTPYKNHPFIEGLENFVDVENRAHKDGVVYPLLMYSFSKVDYGLDVDTVQSDAFQNGDEFNAFLKSLYQFYLDTNAQEFFQSAKLQSDMSSYLKSEMELWPIESLFSNMEWHRIVDENIVRVIETAIFSDVMDDEKMAFDLILKKEIQFGGMPKLEDMYHSLSLYEADREKYKTIDAYLPNLITIMFN